jgi:hypothetical protein
LVCCIALGGVSKKPDAEMHAWLQRASLILLSLDFDDVGKNRYAFWMNLYPNLRPWPAPYVKSPGDFFLYDKQLEKWIFQGLKIG